jgi:hypothetical protein
MRDLQLRDDRRDLIECLGEGVGVVAGSGVVPSGGGAAAAATAGRIGLVDIQSSFITAGVRDARSYAVNGTALPALALARAWRAKAPADAGTSDRSCLLDTFQISLVTLPICHDGELFIPRLDS